MDAVGVSITMHHKIHLFGAIIIEVVSQRKVYR
jgi:hypothetical protein